MNSYLSDFKKISTAMNAMTFQSDAEISYDLLSDALWWTDERPPLTNFRPRDFWCLRFVFRYRTSVILNDIDEDYEDYWNEALIRFPNWAGFHESRCSPNRELAEIYRQMEAGGMQSFGEIGGRDV
ncbi:hypothetical protein Mal52_37610 [Symmachiella dynata]|uniref:Uncharacterized protein n=2 Tax=Symmachiella dynata TaxID=2527995 RepID=A0A517ZS06_9PLAN|nr:hypothetical protein Mal52_37610 [Symmachiella dynata]